MKKTFFSVLILMILIVVVLSFYSSKEQRIFKGDSVNWEAQLSYTNASGGITRELLRVTYKKKERIDGYIGYELKRIGGSMSGEDMKLDSNNHAIKKTETQGSFAVPPRDQSIILTIKVDGQTETIELKPIQP
ncbi:hypothetical protein [Paenibacillus puerhi]|uniref:hypothetical protein n=1 Tax=Paenibacillus puerhi TaxID=2692622 RepID=UPI0013583E17|nr:hypothetical protein [Paenibacillus puerhi]